MGVNEKIAFSPKEAAITLGLCLYTIYKLLKEGRLKAVKLDRKILIPRTEIDRLLRPVSPNPPLCRDTGDTKR